VNSLKTQKTVCAETGVPFYRLEYLHRTGKINEPMRDSCNRRLYSEDDIKAIKSFLKSNIV
jgi:DNA-binding transcriptional MerR regulator